MMPVLLLLLFSLALSIGIGIITMILRRCRGEPSKPSAPPSVPPSCPYERSCVFRRPSCWLAVRSRSLSAVQAALGLHNPKPCSWLEGIAGDEPLFIAPPVKNWILVFGSCLPDPCDDADVCFRFLLDLSRKLGQVQLFSTSSALSHHAWVQADRGRVVRAYAWAGRTLWNQGVRTRAETDLDLKCFGYLESPERVSFSLPDSVVTNVDKVPLLAARWSLDPARVDEHLFESGHGIAGEVSRRF